LSVWCRLRHENALYILLCVVRLLTDKLNIMTKVKSNQSKRTFTIRTENAKYRTCVFTKEEFEELECNTVRDWEYFLQTENYYYLIK